MVTRYGLSLLGILLVLFSVSCSNSSSTEPDDPQETWELEVLSPNGGEDYQINYDQMHFTVTWSASANLTAFDVYLTRAGGLTWYRVNDQRVTGSEYHWDYCFPPGVQLSGVDIDGTADHWARVIGYDASGIQRAVVDSNGAFQVKAACDY